MSVINKCQIDLPGCFRNG